jgi:hypothetical protein
MGSRFSFIVTGRIIHALNLVDVNNMNTTVLPWYYSLLRKYYELHETDDSGLIYDLPVTISLLLGMSASDSVNIKKAHNQMQSAIFAEKIQIMQQKMKNVIDIVDTFEQKYKKGWYWLVLVVAILLLLNAPYILAIYTTIKTILSSYM